MPRFVWSGRLFWAAWLLVFLLPITSHEARLHFLGSHFFPQIYDLPWQKRWMAPQTASTPGLTPLERAIWLRVRGNYTDLYYGYGSRSNPSSTPGGQLLKSFPKEGWLRALALQQSLGWSSLAKQSDLIKWARTGERLDPQNAFFPLMLAKMYGDNGRKKERAAALQRAANGTRFDNGLLKLKSLSLSAAHKAGVETWSEEWHAWSRSSYYGSASTNQIDALLNQLSALSRQDIAAARNTKSPDHLRAALKRSNELMRVSLLLQSSPADASLWRCGEKWVRAAWRISRTPQQYQAFPEPTAQEFIAFAKTQKSEPNVRLAQKCAARIQLLAPHLRPTNLSDETVIFSPVEMFWAQVANPFGFGVLGFEAYLIGWWWLISMFLWRASGQESQRSTRLLPASLIIGATIAMFTGLTLLVMNWVNTPTFTRRGPPPGQLEVAAACGLFAFFAPPLLLALWCALRTQLKNRDALAFPARQQIEMNLSPLDTFVLTRATGLSALSLLGLCVSFSLLWGVLNWNKLTGYDWLRFIWPSISTRAVDPHLTSFESPVMPIYGALCAMTLSLVWLISWRYSTEPKRRPIFHDGLRAWKETLGCAITLTAWVYLVLMIVCHFSGNAFSERLDTAAKRGEGAFITGF